MTGWLVVDRETVTVILRVGLVVAVGLPLILLASRWGRTFMAARYTAQWGMVTGKLVFYLGVALLLVSVLRELGFALTPLLGAAGIVGIALGFASQTSVSNIISGLLLIGEQPFEVGDIIEVESTVGKVLSVDLMSVKLRTFDNRFVRIPNETMVKSQVVTITRFPIRRIDIRVRVAYREDVARVRETLTEVAHDNPRVLVEPAPVVFFDGFEDSFVNLRLAAWTTRERFWDVRTVLQEEVKARFDEEGIEIPVPHRSLHAGSGMAPFPVRLVEEEPPEPAVAGGGEPDGGGGGPTGGEGKVAASEGEPGGGEGRPDTVGEGESDRDEPARGEEEGSGGAGRVG